MRKPLFVLLMSGAVLIAACGDEKPEPKAAAKSVAAPQIEALQQTKEVERQILDAEAEHRRMLEERIDQGQ